MALSCAKSPCKLLLLVYYAPHLLLLTVWAFARTTDKAKAPPAGASGARAVSYTHLDVYKRQVCKIETIKINGSVLLL